jgi:cell division septum initiation protein DivIVA
MGKGKVRDFLDEVRGRVEELQAKIDDKPLLRAAIEALKARLAQMSAEVEAEPEEPASPA